MKPPLLPLLILPLLSGCQIHIPPGGAKKAGVQFGVPMVFSVEKTIANVKVTESKIAIGDTQTKVTIFAFEWKSFAESLALTNPPEN